jgi:hypothetical protein
MIGAAGFEFDSEFVSAIGVGEERTSTADIQ